MATGTPAATAAAVAAASAACPAGLTDLIVIAVVGSDALTFRQPENLFPVHNSHSCPAGT